MKLKLHSLFIKANFESNAALFFLCGLDHVTPPDLLTGNRSSPRYSLAAGWAAAWRFAPAGGGRTAAVLKARGTKVAFSVSGMVRLPRHYTSSFTSIRASGRRTAEEAHGLGDLRKAPPRSVCRQGRGAEATGHFTRTSPLAPGCGS